MAEINRVTLFGKLNPATYKVVEGATVFCKLRGNPTVELEHVVAQLLQSTDSDWHRVIQQAQLDSSVLAKDITAALDRLPRGATSSYGQIAVAAGAPAAVRAAGAAIGRNPVSVLVPCHRVLGRNGALTGYAGGLHRKSALLQAEGVLLA